MLYFALVMAGAAVLYAAGLNGRWRFQRDSLVYMGLARSLAEAHTYSFDYTPHALVWPGFPAMLSVVRLAFGDSFLAMNALVKVFGLGCIAMACLLFARLSLTWPQMVACALLIALSRTLYYYSSQIMADVPFAFFVLAGLYCGVRMLQSDADPGGDRRASRAAWLWCVGAALTALVACSLRPLAPALLVALVAALYLRRGGRARWRRNLAMTGILLAPAVLLSAAWLWRSANLNESFRYGYLDLFIWRYGLLHTVLHAFGAAPKVVLALADGVLGFDFPPLSIVLFLVMAVGLVAAWRRGERVLTLFGIACLAGTCLGNPGRRHLLPVLPVLFYWLVLGASAVGSLLAARWRAASPRRLAGIGAALLFLGVATNAARVGKVIYEQRSPDFYARTSSGRLADYFQLADWLKANAMPGEVVIGYEYRLLFYFSGVKAEPLPRPGRNWRMAWARRLPKGDGLAYLVRDPAKDATAPAVDNMLRRHPDAFEEVRRFGRLQVFRVEPSALMKD